MSGVLYVVATPIGNLADMVPRALDVLQKVDLIASEDTRHSGRLLAHFNIDTPMMAYHDHSDEHQVARIIDSLQQGKNVALISDAGTPLVSDPGFKLVRAARQRGFGVIPVPGACAAIAALSASGLPSDRFSFEGFPPHKRGPRQKFFAKLKNRTATLIFYEAPHRILGSLEDMSENFVADRQAVMARELTKTFETFLLGSLDEIREKVAADPNQQKGEIVLLVQGAEAAAEAADEAEQERVLKLLMKELPVKQASVLTAKITGGQKNALYTMALAIKRESGYH